MKAIITGLAVLFLVLQYQLWFAKGSLLSAWKMQQTIEKQTTENDAAKKRNNRLKTDINDLKQDKHALEARARNDLGMIKKDETFYQVVTHENDSST